jgi:hypothetical protein
MTPLTTTVTTELIGGPVDGITQPYVRRAGEDMPLEHPSFPGYHLVQLETRVAPPRWRYGWRHPRSGLRNPCRQGERCRGARCPSRTAPA